MAAPVLVTGATGFVGAAIVRALLARGEAVRVLARPTSDRRNVANLHVEVVEGRLEDATSLRKAMAGCRVLIHTAADYRIWVPDPAEMMRSNVDGTVNVLRAGAKAGAERIVHCSSVAAVRLDKTGAPADEASEYADESSIIGVYKKSKWLSERAALELAAQGLPVVVVNPAAPIGPWDVKPTPTGKIIVDFLNRKLPSYVDTGLNVVHVRDVAEGHWLAARKGRVGQRYILAGTDMTLKAILETLSELSGLPAPRFKTPYAVAYAVGVVDELRLRLVGGEPVAPLDAVRMARHKMYFTAAKAVRELGLPQTPARTALKDAVDWFKANGYVR